MKLSLLIAPLVAVIFLMSCQRAPTTNNTDTTTQTASTNTTSTSDTTSTTSTTGTTAASTSFTRRSRITTATAVAGFVDVEISGLTCFYLAKDSGGKYVNPTLLVVNDPSQHFPLLQLPGMNATELQKAFGVKSCPPATPCKLKPV